MSTVQALKCLRLRMLYLIFLVFVMSGWSGDADIPVGDRDLSGIWLGKLVPMTGELRVVFHLARTESGQYTATLDSPDQGAEGIPAGPVIVRTDSLIVNVPVVSGRFRGKIGEFSIDGVWEQGGYDFPLVLEKVEEVTKPPRPQEPDPPYPYDEEEVTYTNEEAGVTLAGTLTLPRSPGPHPAVILISGSGAQDRNETVFNHKPFLVLADHLTRHGIAVLRADDRGMGGSSGSVRTSTSEDFAEDVLAGVDCLKNRPEIDPERIGLAGHSEGGIVAPMAAVRSNDVAFIVMMAGTGLTGEKIVLLQSELIGEKDLQVPAEPNLRAIGEALKAGGNTDYTLHMFPGLNHMFQKAETGSPTEYMKIEQTFAPEALEYITDWIRSRTITN